MKYILTILLGIIGVTSLLVGDIAQANNTSLPTDYLGPRDLAECQDQIELCAQASNACKQKPEENKYAKNSTYCGLWKTQEWSEVKAFFADCYKFQWSTSNEKTKDAEWNFAQQGKPEFYHVSTKKLTYVEACSQYFPTKKDADTTAIDSLAGITKDTCPTFGDTCSKLYNACSISGSINPFNDVAAVCSYIFEKGGLVAARKSQTFTPCLTAVNKEIPGAEKCTLLKSENKLTDQCQCGGQIGATMNSVKSDKKACCTQCKTSTVKYGQEQVNCSAELGKPVVENCSCNGFNQKFALTDTKKEACCFACNVNSFIGKVISTTFNSETLKCEGSGLAPMKDVNIPGITKFPNPVKSSIGTPQEFLGNVIKTVLGIVGTIAFALIVYGGFIWMVSAGNGEKVKMGQQTILWAALGLIAISASYAIVSFIIKNLG